MAPKKIVPMDTLEEALAEEKKKPKQQTGTTSVGGIEIDFPVGVVTKNQLGIPVISDNVDVWRNWERTGKTSKQRLSRAQLETLAEKARYTNPILFKYIRGLFPANLDNDDVVNAWEDAIDLAELTQLDVNRLVKTKDFLASYEDKGDRGGPGMSTQTYLNQLDRAGARVLLEETYGQLLGRRPTAKEVNTFKDIVNKRMAKRPTQQVVTTDGMGNTIQQTIPGYGEEEIALEARRQAEARPEFAGYQMATTFYDSILRAAGSPARVPGPTQ